MLIDWPFPSFFSSFFLPKFYRGFWSVKKNIVVLFIFILMGNLIFIINIFYDIYLVYNKIKFYFDINLNDKFKNEKS